MMKKVVIVGLLVLVVLAGVGLGKEIVVTNTADSGTGSLRWALQTARSGDTITFDPSVFPPDDPATILVRSEIPPLLFGNLTIDASNAGVILNGELSETSGVSGIVIRSAANVVQGLQIVNFSQCGIFMSGLARNNTIGGDRNTGNGPFGQGNAIGQCNGGIVLWGMQATGNTILGNVIGTDITGTENLGNVDGATIGGGGTRNVIGPDNLIAHNRESGVLIDGPDTSGNTITQNRIWNNGWAGIRFEGFYTSDADFVLETVDPAAGLISGRACAGCVIEFFSDTDLQGVLYEGRTTANEDGFFQLLTGTALSGPNLTATRTDTSGTTSLFLGPLLVVAEVAALQEGNNLLRTLLLAPQSEELEYNRIGVMHALLDSAGTEDFEFLINMMDSFGLMWDKFYIDVPDGNEVGVLEGYSDGNITSTQDMLFDEFIERGWKIVLGLVYWDESANERVAQQGLDYSRYETEEEVQAYLNHIQSMARHLKGRIEYYEILNEPNAAIGSQQYVQPDDYINLVRRVAPIIRQEDPGAEIVFGAVASAFSGMGDEGIEYLFSIVESDVVSFVDVISWHPFNGESPGDLASRDYYYGYPDLVRRIKSVATSYGFSGEFMASELFWRSPPTWEICIGCGGPESSIIQAAKYYARGITLHLGLDVIVGVGGLHTVKLIHTVVRNLCVAMAGHEAIDMPAEVDIDYEPVAYCSFRYENGDRMLAIWTDGIAQDEDPGIPATIRFPGLAAETVTGIDVLHGFEQELVFEVDGDDTIIRDLLVKDYPILIRLSDVTMGPDYEETVGDGFHRFGEPGAGTASDRDGDGVPDDEDYCPDWPGSLEMDGC